MADDNVKFDIKLFEQSSLDEQRDMIAEASRAGGDEAITFLVGVTNYRDGEMRFLAKRALNHLGAYTNERFKAVDGALKEDGSAVTEKHINLEALERFLAHEDYQKRLRAVQGADKMGDHRALPLLKDLFEREDHPFVRATLVKTIGKLGGKEVVDLLVDSLNDTDPRVRANTIEGLAYTDEPKIINKLIPLLKDPDNRIRANAAKIISQFDEKSVFDQLEEMMSMPAVWMRSSAAHALGEIETRGSIDLLERMVVSEVEEDVLTQVIKSLARKQSPQATELLKELQKKWASKNSSLKVLLEHSLSEEDAEADVTQHRLSKSGNSLKYISAAAILILLLGGAGYWWYANNDSSESPDSIRVAQTDTNQSSSDNTDNEDDWQNQNDDDFMSDDSEVEETPVDEPPVDVPPVSQPPVDEPPVDEPPVSRPPVDKPPVDEPPVSQPPVTKPPVNKPPVQQDKKPSQPFSPDLASILNNEDNLAPEGTKDIESILQEEQENGADNASSGGSSGSGAEGSELSPEAMDAIRKEIREQIEKEMDIKESPDSGTDSSVASGTSPELALTTQGAKAEKATVEEIGRILEAIKQKRPPKELPENSIAMPVHRPRILVIYPVNESFSADVGVLSYGLRDLIESALSRLEGIDVVSKEDFVAQLKAMNMLDDAADIGENQGAVERMARVLRCDWVIGGKYREVGQFFDNYLNRYIRGQTINLEPTDSDLVYLQGAAGINTQDDLEYNLDEEHVLASSDPSDIQRLSQDEKIEMAEKFYRAGKSLYDRKQYREAYQQFYVSSLYASDWRQVAVLLDDAKIKLAQSISSEAEQAKDNLRFEISLEGWKISNGQKTRTQKFFGPMRDLNDTMRESVLSIITAMKLPIKDGERSQILDSETTSLDAFVEVCEALRLFDLGDPSKGRTNELKEARIMVEEALRLAPSYSRAYILKASIDSEEGFGDRAISAARQAVSLDPRNIQLRYRLVSLLEKNNDAGGAAAELREITRLQGPGGSRLVAQAHVIIAADYLMKRERGLARDAIQKAKSASDMYPYSYLLEGKMAYDAGNFEAATKSVQKVLSLENRDSVTHLLMAKIFERRNLLRDATLSYHNALEALNNDGVTEMPAEILKASNETFDRYDIIFSLGEVSQKTGYISLAREFYQQVISGRPYSELARNARDRVSAMQ